MKAPSKNVPVVTVVNIAGGGSLADGSGVVIEIEVLTGERIALQMPSAVANRAGSAINRFVHDAKLRDKTQEPLSAAGAIEVSASMLSFQAAADGSHGQIVCRPESGPPLRIRVEPEDIHVFRDQFAHMERLMSEARKPKSN